jgi:integrase
MRLVKGYSQSQLARELDVDVITVSRWERGAVPVPRMAEVALSALNPKPKQKRKGDSLMATVCKVGKKWRADWTDNEGTHHRKRFKTKCDADEYLTTIKSQIAEGTYVAPKNVLTFGALADTWIAGRIEQSRTPALKQAGIEKPVSMHKLRHSFASMLILLKRPVTEISRYLSHADVAVTIKVLCLLFEAEETGQDERLRAAHSEGLRRAG